MDLLNRLWRYRLRAWLSAPHGSAGAPTQCGGTWHMTSTRSLRFNASDPAAVVHRALKVVAASATIVDTLLCATETTTAQNTVPGSPNELQLPPLGQAATLALAEYANACAFLHEQVLSGSGPLSPAILSHEAGGTPALELMSALRRYGEVAQRFGGAAAMPMLLLGDPSGLAQRLHATLARVQRLLDAAVRRSAPRGRRWAAAAFKYPRLVHVPIDANGAPAGSSMCPECDKEVKEKNFGGEMACDACLQWFHLRCLQLPENFPNSVGDWFCSACRADRQEQNAQ